MLPEDATRVLEIYKQGIDSGKATFETLVPTWEKWDESYLKVCRLVILDEYDSIVGWCALKPYSKRLCYSGVGEISIYFDTQFQGKGLGKILLQRLILDSEENGFWTLQAGIFQENAASITLHQKLGFRVVGVREKISQINGVWKDVILMERRSHIVGI